jgi:HEAT repeats
MAFMTSLPQRHHLHCAESFSLALFQLDENARKHAGRVACRIFSDLLMTLSEVTTKILTYAVMLPLIASLACGVRNEIERVHKLGNILDANPSDKEMLMQLVEYLSNPNGSLRSQAASVIGNLGAKHSEILGDAVVPLLIARLSDDDAFVRRYAVKALGQYGRKAEPAVNGLVGVLKQYK